MSTKLHITLGLAILLLVGCSRSGEQQQAGGGAGHNGGGSDDPAAKRRYNVRPPMAQRDPSEGASNNNRQPPDHGTLGKVRTLSGRVAAVDAGRNTITVEVKGSQSTFQVEPGVPVMRPTTRTANSVAGLDGLQAGSEVTINLTSHGNQERVSLIQLR